MSLSINGDVVVCPHCGSENKQAPKIWLDLMSDADSARCSNCKKIIVCHRRSDNSAIEKVPNRHSGIRFIIICSLLLGLMIYLNRTFGIFNIKRDWKQIAYEILIILFISSSIAYGMIWKKIKYLTIWAGIFIVMMVGYTYRFELANVKDKVLAEFIPASGFQMNPNEASFPVSDDGHFYIRAKVNGIPIVFLADTGASHIVLSPGDAGKLGFKMDKLIFDNIYETANGTVRGASIQITDLKIGDILMQDIGASVNEAEMRNSLLGMTFFKRLKSYEVKNDILTIYWGDV